MTVVHALLGCAAFAYLIAKHGGRVGWAFLALSFVGAALAGCPETPSPSWPEQHHAGVR